MKDIFYEFLFLTVLALSIPFIVFAFDFYSTLLSFHKYILIFFSFLTVAIFDVLFFCVYCLIEFLIFNLIIKSKKRCKSFFDSIRALIQQLLFYCSKLNNFQKYTFCFSIVSIIMLGISLWAIVKREDLSSGFFIFQKIIVFGSVITMCFEGFFVWWKVLLILDAIIFNPIIQIHLGYRDSWMFFDIITIVFFIVSWIVLFRKTKVNNGSTSTR